MKRFRLLLLLAIFGTNAVFAEDCDTIFCKCRKDSAFDPRCPSVLKQRQIVGQDGPPPAPTVGRRTGSERAEPRDDAGLHQPFSKLKRSRAGGQSFTKSLQLMHGTAGEHAAPCNPMALQLNQPVLRCPRVQIPNNVIDTATRVTTINSTCTITNSRIGERSSPPRRGRIRRSGSRNGAVI